MNDAALTRTAPAAAVAQAILAPLGGDPGQMAGFSGGGDLPSAFAVTDLAAGAFAAAGSAVSALIAAGGRDAPAVTVDRRLASFWLGSTIKPDGWSRPPAWDPIAGDYQASDGWIRLHTNAPHHRDAALAVLGTPAEKAAVTAAVATWRADELEAAVVAQGGCAAAMRDLGSWAAHPNGRAVAEEPIIWTEDGDPVRRANRQPAPDRPLAGIRVLDLTRVLAGPVATRFLAGFGADVLRIDPPWWSEPGVVPEVTLGKRCARLDLRSPADRLVLEGLLAGADVLVHGYRADALARLGLDAAARRALCPGLIDVSLDAYGWTGPWRDRRGFDSLVQMSAGIAAEGMRRFGKDVPTPLPYQALDQATGTIMAAAAIRGLTRRLTEGVGSVYRTSLARTAALLTSIPFPERDPKQPGDLAPLTMADFNDTQEATPWGPAHRMKPPLTVSGAAMRWDRPACELGSSEASWLPR